MYCVCWPFSSLAVPRIGNGGNGEAVLMIDEVNCGNTPLCSCIEEERLAEDFSTLLACLTLLASRDEAAAAD